MAKRVDVADGVKRKRRAVPDKSVRKVVPDQSGGRKKPAAKSKKKKPEAAPKAPAKSRAGKSVAAKPAAKIPSKKSAKPVQAAVSGKRTADQVRADNSALKRQISTAARDIGAIPEIANLKRRKAGEKSLKKFLLTYFPEQFSLKFSPDQLMVIKAIQERAINGGLQAIAMPRGTGKTTIVECASIWVTLNGLREFVMLIGASETHASEMLDSIKTELETNELLLEDYPEVIFPIQALEGISHRARAQTSLGKRTHIGWTSNEIVMPTIEGSKASGVVMRVAGITGRIRGAKFKRSDGVSSRPDFVILDDPQTDESARSVSQSQARESVIAGAVLGLAGPGKKIAGLMPCTVIRPGDMCDRILDKQKNPEWNGIRTKLMVSFPDNEDLWDEYAKVRASCLRSKANISDATAFYVKNRKAMDKGAKVSWKERFNPDEKSAIQNAMNLKLRDNAAFFAEYQNDPLPDENFNLDDLTKDIVMSRLSGMPGGVLPSNTAWLTAACDVQQSSLWWAITAWSENASGTVIDYGVFPEFKKHYFTLRDVNKALDHMFPGIGVEGQIFSGLEKFCGALLQKDFSRADGGTMRIERMLIDSGFKPDVIHDYCKKSPFGNILIPTLGRGVTAAQEPMNAWKKKRGERVGDNFRIMQRYQRDIRSAVYDTNFWKAWIEARIMTAPGDPGSMTFYGKDPDRHTMIADHLTAEFKVRNQARGRTVDQYALKPGRDNHWLDAIVGCAVAAAMQGMPTLVGPTSDGGLKMGSGRGQALLDPAKKKKMSFSALQRAAKARQQK